MTYDEWYHNCNLYCLSKAGVGIDDVPDGPSRAAYDDGVPASEYVDERLEEEGFPTDMTATAPPRRRQHLIRYTEDITLHSGEVIRIERQGAANGRGVRRV